MPVHQYWCDETIKAKLLETEGTEKPVRELSTSITKTNRHKKFWVAKGTDIAVEFRCSVKSEGLKSYSTMSRLGPDLLNVQYDPCKKIITVITNSMEGITITTRLSYSETQFPEKKFR